MKRVWSDDNKYEKWLAVELAVCEAWCEEGVIPPEDLALLLKAEYDPQRMDEIFQTTRHDVTGLHFIHYRLHGAGRAMASPGADIQRYAGHRSGPWSKPAGCCWKRLTGLLTPWPNRPFATRIRS